MVKCTDLYFILTNKKYKWFYPLKIEGWLPIQPKVCPNISYPTDYILCLADIEIAELVPRKFLASDILFKSILKS